VDTSAAAAGEQGVEGLEARTEAEVDAAAAAAQEREVTKTAPAQRREVKSAITIESTILQSKDLGERAGTTAALFAATARQRDEEVSLAAAAIQVGDRQGAASTIQIRNKESTAGTLAGEAEEKNREPVEEAGVTAVEAAGLAEGNILHREEEPGAPAAAGAAGTRGKREAAAVNEDEVEEPEATSATAMVVTEGTSATVQQREYEDTDAYSAMQQRFQEAAAVRRRYEEAGAAVWLRMEEQEAQKRSQANMAKEHRKQEAVSRQLVEAAATEVEYARQRQLVEAAATEVESARQLAEGDADAAVCSWCVFWKGVGSNSQQRVLDGDGD
jgi:hypothetical protein